MAIMLTISLASPVPIHDQLVAGLRGLIAAGQLAEGDELPPVRQLAADLGINLKPARDMGMRTIKVGEPGPALDALESMVGFALR